MYHKILLNNIPTRYKSLDAVVLYVQILNVVMLNAKKTYSVCKVYVTLTLKVYFPFIQVDSSSWFSNLVS